MKISVFIGFLYFIHFASLPAQTRYPINPSSVWRVNYRIMEYSADNRVGDETINFYIEGDTFINAALYFKLFKSGIAYYDDLFHFDHVYVCAIRDENNKIFYVDKDNTSELFLYDFDLQTGDTIKSEIEKGSVVTGIEILQGGRKKITFNKTKFPHGECLNWNNAYFIEGIGSMGGIFYPTPCNHVGFREHYLVCYSENVSSVYQSTLSPDNCDLYTSTSGINELPNVFFYHNSEEIVFMFDFQNFTFNKVVLSLYNSMGVLVQSEVVDLEMKTTQVQLQGLPVGVYIAMMNADGICIVEKFIIDRKV